MHRSNQRLSLLRSQNGRHLSEAGVCACQALHWCAAVAVELLLQALLGLADPLQVQLVSQICQRYGLHTSTSDVDHQSQIVFRHGGLLLPLELAYWQMTASQSLHTSGGLDFVEAQRRYLLEDCEGVSAAVRGLVPAHGALQAVAGHRLCIQLPVVRLHPQ